MRNIATFLGVIMLLLAFTASACDHPFGAPDGTPRCPGSGSCSTGWWDAQPFLVNNHLGSDWNYASGSSDLGKPITAITAGEVVYSGDAGSGWNGVTIIKHTGNFSVPGGGSVTSFTSMYAHLDKTTLAVKVGDRVAKGQLLGKIGPTPTGSTGPHLHFEIRINANTAVGPGYSSNSTGWTNPTAFIDANRTVEGTLNIPANGTFVGRFGSPALYYVSQKKFVELVSAEHFFLLYNGTTSGTFPVLPKYPGTFIDANLMATFITPGCLFRSSSVGYPGFAYNQVFRAGDLGMTQSGWTNFKARPFSSRTAFENYAASLGLTGTQLDAKVVFVADNRIEALINSIGGIGSPITETAPTVSWSMSPTSKTVSSNSGSTTFTISNSGSNSFVWSATSSGSAITGLSANAGTVSAGASKTVTVNFSANTSTSSRTATVTVTVAGATKTFKLTQSGVACNFSTSPTVLSFAASGGTAPVTVTASATTCPFSSSSSVSWITLTGGSGTGSGTVQVTASANAGAARSGSVTIAGQTVGVSQAVGTVIAPTATPQVDFTVESSGMVSGVINRGPLGWTDLLFVATGKTLTMIGLRSWGSTGTQDNLVPLTSATDQAVTIAAFMPLDGSFRGTLIAKDSAGNVYWADLSLLSATLNSSQSLVASPDGTYTLSPSAVTPLCAFAFDGATLVLRESLKMHPEFFLNVAGTITSVILVHYWSAEPWTANQLLNASGTTVIGSIQPGERFTFNAMTSTGQTVWLDLSRVTPTWNSAPLLIDNGAFKVPNF